MLYLFIILIQAYFQGTIKKFSVVANNSIYYVKRPALSSTSYFPSGPLHSVNKYMKTFFFSSVYQQEWLSRLF